MNLFFLSARLLLPYLKEIRVFFLSKHLLNLKYTKITQFGHMGLPRTHPDHTRTPAHASNLFPLCLAPPVLPRLDQSARPPSAATRRRRQHAVGAVN